MIDFTSVSLTHKQKTIFANLDLEIVKHEKRLIVGPSGKGKTSLLKLALGFERPEKGEIKVNRLPVNPENIHSIREQIFYLSQDVDLPNEILFNFLSNLFPEAKNGIDTVLLGDLLSFFELDEDILNQHTTDLSGGERQRVGLLIGFLLDRPIWLLDEPTAALDSRLKEKVVSKIITMNKTMIIISHDSVWQNNDIVAIERW